MTGRKILNIALDLLNMRSSDGTLPDNCADFEKRAVNIINLCLAECSPLNVLLCKTEPYIPVTDDLDSEIDYETGLLISVIPLGVAAYLCADEDPALSDRFTEKYRVAFKNAARNSKARLHSITEVY